MKLRQFIPTVLLFAVGSPAFGADVFATPTHLGTNINTDVPDESPFLSPDGLSLYLARPVFENFSIHWATRADVGAEFGPAVDLQTDQRAAPGLVNYNMSVTTNGLSMFYASSPDFFSTADMYEVTRPTISDDFDFANPVSLGPNVNFDGEDSGRVSADGLTLVYGRVDHPDGYGDADIWISARQTTADSFGPAENLGPTINTPHREAWPTLSPGRAVNVLQLQPSRRHGRDGYLGILPRQSQR